MSSGLGLQEQALGKATLRGATKGASEGATTTAGSRVGTSMGQGAKVSRGTVDKGTLEVGIGKGAAGILEEGA
ncbi:unnamed protein product, partial [Ilex paraguariensis]